MITSVTTAPVRPVQCQTRRRYNERILKRRQEKQVAADRSVDDGTLTRKPSGDEWWQPISAKVIQVPIEKEGKIVGFAKVGVHFGLQEKGSSMFYSYRFSRYYATRIGKIRRWQDGSPIWKEVGVSFERMPEKKIRYDDVPHQSFEDLRLAVESA